MKRIIYLICLAGIAWVLFSCSHVKAPPGAKGDKMIWSSYKNPPAWVYNKGKRKNGYIYATGVSPDYVATEQVARKEALDDSIQKITTFVATKAERKMEKIASSFGLSSSKLDPSVARREFVKLASKNVVAGLEVKDWYFQKWIGPKGVTWKAYVYARVSEKIANQAMKTFAEKNIQSTRLPEQETEAAKKQVDDVNRFWEQMKGEDLFD